jgi:DNA-binding LytR/AlgR family response regulator
MNVLILEDEELAAQRFQRMLRELQPTANVLAVIDNVADAVAWLQTHAQPDLLFCDIQLADALSFDVFKQVNVTSPVVFVTAFDDYAIQAFKVNSIDYLLKPVKKEELAQALAKYQRMKKADVPVSQLMQWLQQNKPQQHAERFLVQVGQQLKTIDIADVAYFYTHDKIIFLVAKDGKRYAVDYQLDKLEQMLEPSKFFRINRQYIVSIDAIDKMTAYPKSRVKIELKPAAPDDTVTSTERSSDFKKWLAGQG